VIRPHHRNPGPAFSEDAAAAAPLRWLLLSAVRSSPVRAFRTDRLRPAGIPSLLVACLALAAALLVTGCSSVSTRKVIALDRFQRFYVERLLNENHHLDEIIVAELRRLGCTADSGPRTMMPAHTEVLVTYDARWTWDFHTYLIELNLELHTVFPSKKLADGRYYQPSIKPRAPVEVVRGLLGPLFGR